MTLPDPGRRPVSTYRLQFNAAFRFVDARDLVGYLADLGVTECYASPYLASNPGSTHGYDICDHSRLDPELGTRGDYDEWSAALDARGMGQILDFVPNHMACDARSNPWWRDVLENGPSSPFAPFFDIEWDPIKPELKGKVLLPILGDQYGRVLERGELRLLFDEGALHVRYFGHDLPINPRQSPRVLGLHSDRLERARPGDPAVREFLSILTALLNLPPYTERDQARIVERQREKEVARERLVRLIAESATVRGHVEACVREANGVAGDRASFDVLHELLEEQPYRLAYWRTAFDEINYRRFFDINELVGLRMEEPVVFAATHALLARLIHEREVTGVRVDHPDGLFDPQEYFERLQHLAGTPPVYVVAEKILSSGEPLTRDWQVHGTTGYEFLNAVSGLFVDGRQAARLRRIWGRFTGRHETFEQVAYESRRAIMLTAMASELNVLAHALNRISERDRRTRDFTLNSCRKVLREVVACFPVYRTYVSRHGVSAFDRAAVDEAIDEARRRNPVMEASIFEFLRGLLLLEQVPGVPASDSAAEERLQFAMKAQQFTGPVQAKGVEDTAFYRYNVLISANDVGGHPGRLGVTVDEFHAANGERLAAWPLAMSATATHDTKRGEDARVRLHVLSELPDAWRRAVSEWMRINGRHRTKVRGAWAPDRNDEYLFYQALLGVWPAEPPTAPIAAPAPPDLVGRIAAYMQKAVREAKVHTSWIDEDQAYGRALEAFVTRALTGSTAERFLRAFLPFQRRVAALGAANALAQLVLKLVSPGVPDFYQGTELWDFDLVDPDNRRAVDFTLRRTYLSELEPWLVRAAGDPDAAAEVPQAVSGWLDRWEDGRIKLFVTACGLRLRRDLPDLFLQGAYVPLAVEGAANAHVVACARRWRTSAVVAIVPRLVAGLVGGADHRFPTGAALWRDTAVRLPKELEAASYQDVLTGRSIAPAAGAGARTIALGEALGAAPVALLRTDDLPHCD